MDFQTLIIIVPVLLISVIAHEYAHGYAALRQGDTTAYMLGRLTWNPVKHIDPFLTIILPAMLFISTGGRMMLGGAKPVPVDPRNYRNYRRGDIIVSLAGVATNLAIAILSTILVPVLGAIGRAAPSLAPTMGLFQAMALYAILLNFVLILFNLIPIPPLDGSHVVKHLLPPAMAVRYEQLGRFGFIILIAAIYFNALDFWMTPAFESFRFLAGMVDDSMLYEGAQWFRRLLG